MIKIVDILYKKKKPYRIICKAFFGINLYPPLSHNIETILLIELSKDKSPSKMLSIREDS